MNTPVTHTSRRFRRSLTIAAVSALVVVGCGGGDDASTTSAQTPGSEPAATSAAGANETTPATGDNPATGEDSVTGVGAMLAPATPIDGSFDPAALNNTAAVIWFWAPWCPKCRAEAPAVAEVHAAFGSEVAFVGVPGQGSIEEMQTFIADTGVGGFPQLADESGGVWTDFGVTAMPAFVFVDAQGNTELVPSALGADELSNKVEQLTA